MLIRDNLKIFLSFAVLGSVLGYYANSSDVLVFSINGCVSSLVSTFLVLKFYSNKEGAIEIRSRILIGIVIGVLSLVIFAILTNILYPDGIPGQFTRKINLQHGFEYFKIPVGIIITLLQSFPAFLLCSISYAIVARIVIFERSCLDLDSL